MPASTNVGLNALPTPENCVLLLIDHQPFQLENVNSHDPTVRTPKVSASQFAEDGKIKLLHEALDTLAASKAFSND